MFFTFGGMYLAVRALSAVTYTLSTGVGGFVWGYFATYGTQKSLPRLIGRKEFLKNSRWTSLQLEIYRGVLFGGLMCLTWISAYYVKPLIEPYIPRQIRSVFAYTAQASSGNQILFVFFCIIFVFLLLTIGVYSLHGEESKENRRLRAENEELRKKLRNKA